VQDSGIDHEIGLHSYAHQPFDDMIKSEVRDDVSAGQQILSEYGIEPESFVFPQNRIAHLDVLAASGIRTYRDKLDNGWLPSVVRQFVPPTVSPSESQTDIVAFPGSLFIADPIYPSSLTRLRAIAGIQKAIITDRIIHFWLHPHNIITNPPVLDGLTDIFERIAAHRRAGEIEVATMSQAIK
jgi:peptidoglycan/xylan/chitin deacetylase (PgdA/CDA1 family)